MQTSSTSSTILGGLRPDILQTYQAIRYSKMYQTTSCPEMILDIATFKRNLSILKYPVVKFRVHYYLQDQVGPITGSMSASLFQTFLKYDRSFTLDIIYKNESYEVLDISFPKELISIYFTDSKILSLLQFATLLEIHSLSPQTSVLTFSGYNSSLSFPTQFLLHPASYTRPAIIFQEKPPELVDLWIAFLQEKWQEFFHDVKDRSCSLDYFQNGYYNIRRKFTFSRPAVFTHPRDLEFLKELQVVSIIPTCHPIEITQRPLTIDAIIDIDPSRFITDTERILVANSLAEYLLQHGLVFNKRLSGGVHKGFHYIIELKVSRPLDLITNTAAPQNYFFNKPERIIINSVRESIIALLVNFLKMYKSENLSKITSIEPDPYKIRFDVTRTVLHGGKRALYSMHKGTTSIVLPLPYTEHLTETLFQEYSKLSELDVAFAHAESIHERQATNSEITKNSNILKNLNQEHLQLWKSYCMSHNKAIFLKTL